MSRLTNAAYLSLTEGLSALLVACDVKLASVPGHTVRIELFENLETSKSSAVTKVQFEPPIHRGAVLLSKSSCRRFSGARSRKPSGLLDDRPNSAYWVGLDRFFGDSFCSTAIRSRPSLVG